MARGRGRTEKARGRAETARRGSQKGGGSRESEERRTEGADQNAGQIILVATPLGNLGDVTQRTREALESCDLVVAEDTRVGSRLLTALGIKKPLMRADEHASDSVLNKILDEVSSGKSVVVTSDAGTPGISDPGARLVDLAYEAGLAVDALPGPSAPANALALSGFFAQRYVFMGYLPRKAGPQISELSSYRESTIPIVFFEAAPRIGKTLANVYTALGDRRVAICREMTKKFQQVVRGDLAEILEKGIELKGELTVIVEGFRRGKAELG